MIDGAILAAALYPEKAAEIHRIVLRGEILKLAFVGGFLLIALIVTLFK